MKPQKYANLQRIICAAGYSIKGLKSAYANEAAFRQEVWLSFFLLPLSLFLGDGVVEKVLLAGSVFLILIVELLNSAIETVVDRISPEHHELSGRAKDIASAAVFITIMLCAFTWLLILIF